MAYVLPPLPYEYDALEPYMSEETLRYHHDKHHQGYVEKLNKLCQGTEFEEQTLTDVLRATAGVATQQDIFNNAGQVWNHTLFWLSMRPGGGGEPNGEAKRLIDQSFGSYDRFRSEFIEASVDHFGSGYAWLVFDAGGIDVISTPNAEVPMIGRAVPLLNCDLWEHAYYLDHRHDRAGFVHTFLDHLVDWEMVNIRLAEEQGRSQGHIS